MNELGKLAFAAVAASALFYVFGVWMIGGFLLAFGWPAFWIILGLAALGSFKGK